MEFSMDNSWIEKVVLVTGANHGIGAVTIRAFAARGTAVVIHYLDTPQQIPKDAGYRFLHVNEGRNAAEELVREIEASGGRATQVAGDLSDPASIPSIFDRAEAMYGKVDILVNNAAHCEEPDTIFTTSSGSLDRTFAVNVRAAVLLMAEYVRRFQQRGGTWGCIINLSTDAAQRFSGQISYGASKATMEAFTRSVAIEVGPLGITVNAIAPGPVQTGWINSEMEQNMLHEIPLGRIGQPEDIAETIVFLASEQADWLTGQVIKVSGGHVI
jgi:3-oxoacyl-[acyl-carrier protein] reductase